jgi:hypothetical protein
MVKTRKLKKSLAFWPPKYYKGLTKKQQLKRKQEIKTRGKLHWKNPKAYVPLKTNTILKTKKKSSYTEQWEKLFPNAKSLEERAKVTGVPVRFLRESYNRGMAAWRTGHRPGMTQQAWSYPRVSSLLLCGKTHYTADADLVRKAKAVSASARKWWSKQCRN